MYRKGDLKIAPADCSGKDKDGYLCSDRLSGHSHPWDSRVDKSPRLFGGVYLPHSCDEWAVGGTAEILELMSDLMIALIALDPKAADELAANIRHEVAFAKMSAGLDEALGEKKEKKA